MGNADESKYKFFDRRFLVMPDDKDIIGKRVFYADRIQDLIKDVESGDFGQTGILEDIDTVNDENAFIVRATDCSSLVMWGLVYHDPSYEARVAYSQGRTIEYHRKGDWEDEWHVSIGGVVDPKCYDYRVKKPDTWYVHPSADEYGNYIGHPFYKDTSNRKFVEFEGTKEECDKWIKEHTPRTRRMTNRELAKWCADNKGQYTFNDLGSTTVFTTFNYSFPDDEPVPENIRIREWNSTEWHEPLVEVKE